MHITYRLAQINFARTRAPLGDPRMAGYVKLLKEVNRLAEASPGFIWRMDELGASAAGDRLFPKHASGTTLVNLSVWKSVGALRRHVQFSMNGAFMDERRNWFRRYESRFVVFWWVPDGHFPEVSEGWKRLQHLQKYGETGYAFNFVRTFPPPPDGQDYLPHAPATPSAQELLGHLPDKPIASRRIAYPPVPWYLEW